MTPDEAPQNADTPTPPPTPDTPEVPWQKRYEDLRPEFDRTNQTLTSLKSDESALLKFLEENHPDLLADDEPEPEPYDPDDDEQPLTKAEWKQWQAEQDQARQQEKGQQQFETDLKSFIGDRELSEHGERAIRYAATTGDIKGPDDLRKAVDGWFEYETGLKGAAKAKPRVSHVPANGRPATEVPDWSQMSRQEIDKYMAEQATARSQQ